MTARGDSVPRVVGLTQVFPRRRDDPLGAFLLHLYEAFGDRAAVTVIAPHAPGLARSESFGAIQIRRFRYAPANRERLAYTGEMHRLVARRLSNKILFSLFMLAFLFESLATVRAQRARLIHAHWWLPGGFIGALASFLARVPLIITTHGTDVEQLRGARWTKPLARWVFGRARAVTCASNYLREQLLEMRVVEPSRVHVIPMPLNPLFTHQKSEIAARQSEMILTVTRLSAQKSIDTLIDALAILRERGGEAYLTIVGEGEQHAALEEQTHALHLDARVKFLGERPQADLPDLYQACAVFVLPSIREGLGLVLAEALMCGAPVIAANDGGVTDIVKEGETGLLVPPRNANALADALEKILGDTTFAARLVENGRRWVREHYSSGRVTEAFLKVYEGVEAGDKRDLT